MSEEEPKEEIDLWEKRIEEAINQIQQNLEAARRRVEETHQLVKTEVLTLLETINRNLVRHHKQVKGQE